MQFKRESMIVLYLTGKSQVAIVKALQHLNVNKSFISRTIPCYRDTGIVASRPKSGREKNGTNTRNDPKNEDLIEIHAAVVEILLVS